MTAFLVCTPSLTNVPSPHSAMFEPFNIKAETHGEHAHFLSVMRDFNYSDPSVATRWLSKYIRHTEANIAQLQRLVPPPETLLITHTSPLTNHRFQSAVNSAIRRIAAKRCIPMIDWDELARVHMLNDTAKWAQVTPVRSVEDMGSSRWVFASTRATPCRRVGMRTPFTRMCFQR